MNTIILLPTETLVSHINQSGVRPGLRKLAQFRKALGLRGTPPLGSQEEKEDEAVAYVKIFNPCGRWTWYVTEWDGADQAFGLVCGDFQEVGYVPLPELAFSPGPLGIGMEIDVWFKPKTLAEIQESNSGR
jgi:hypothetical protein